MSTTDPLISAWQISARINLFLWRALAPGQKEMKAAKGKSIFEHFAHIHSVRMMWLKTSAPDLLEGLKPIEGSEEVESQLESSAAAIEALLRRCESPESRIKGSKPHVTAFVAYLVAHEAYHRGQVDLALRLSGVPVDDKTHYGLWEWGVR